MDRRKAGHLLTAVIVIAAGVIVLFRPLGVEGWDRYVPADGREEAPDRAAREALLDDRMPVERRYDALFRYFLHGFVAHLTPAGERVQYAGMGSTRGYSVSGLEGFARTAPLFAAWIHSGRPPVVDDGGTPVDLAEVLRRGILAGTDPAAASYWGTIEDRDQRILEAAEIARVLWLTRAQIWDRLSAAQQRQVAIWLLRVNDVLVLHNNWRMAPVVVNLAVAALGHSFHPDTHLYDDMKRDLAGNGWFHDPPDGIDYYNTWAISYDLFWVRLLAPGFDAPFIERTLAESASLTAHLVGPDGFPIMGRSICYRPAVTVPVIAASVLDGSPEAAGAARRMLDAIWRYFVLHGSLRGGALTQGYFASDPRFLDRYAGPGSCHLGLRSLVLAFMQPPPSPFWTAPEQPMPVEIADYRLDLPALGWIVEGHRDTREIVIRIPANGDAVIVPSAQGVWRRWGERLLGRPLRPRNYAAKYQAGTYSSRPPFVLAPSR